MKIQEISEKIIQQTGKPFAQQDVETIVKSLYEIVHAGIANPLGGKASFPGLGTFVIKNDGEKQRVRFRLTEPKGKGGKKQKKPVE